MPHTDKFDCGCSITMNDQGQVTGVECCPASGVFSENKSLRQLALDIHDHQMKAKIAARCEAANKAAAEKVAEVVKETPPQS